MAFPGLEHKVAIVTGAAGGIGGATVRRLIEEGCRVAAVDLDGDALARMSSAYGADRACAITADVATEAGCDRYVAAAVDAFGSVDLFVNNAGVIGKHYPIAELPPAEFDRVHAVNVRGVFLGLRAVLRRMIAQGTGGAIVNLSSIGGLRAHRLSAAYGSSKRAVIGLSNTAALENGQNGIRVNAICPGAVDTPMLPPAIGLSPGADRSELLARYAQQPIARIAQPAEIASFIAYLLSDEASYQSGGVYTIDGGAIV